LGKHFWPSFAFVLGLKIDYLSPTVYLSDFFLILFILASFFNWFFYQRQIKVSKTLIYLLFLFLLSLLISTFVNGGKPLFFLKFLKILEFSFYALSCALLDSRKIFSSVVLVFSFSILWTSFLGVFQFLKQQSLGLWFLGERNFDITTPGISQLVFSGQLFLRPYATFPHPNLFGAYLALFLPWILFFLLKMKKEIKTFSFLLFTLNFGLLALFLTFSRTSWLVGFSAIFFLLYNLGWQTKQKFFSSQSRRVFFALASVFVFLSFWFVFGSFIQERFLSITTSDSHSLILRIKFIKAALFMFFSSPFFGLGPGNFIPNLPSFWQLQETIRILQPAHNLILLILAETGIFGALSFILLFGWTFFALFSLKKKYKEAVSLFILSLSSIFFLSMFDHYFWTLQQGLFIFWLVLGLSWSFCFKEGGGWV